MHFIQNIFSDVCPLIFILRTSPRDVALAAVKTCYANLSWRLK